MAFDDEPAARIGRPPQLTPEQDREVFDLVRLRREISNKALTLRFGVSHAALLSAYHREQRRRRKA